MKRRILVPKPLKIVVSCSHTSMKRLSILLATLLLAAVALLPALASLDSEAPKDVEFTYARIRYHMTPDAIFVREVPWHHDYPYGDEAFPTFLKEVTHINTGSKAF